MRNDLLLISIIAPFEQHYEKIISSLGEAIELVVSCRRGAGLQDKVLEVQRVSPSGNSARRLSGLTTNRRKLAGRHLVSWEE